MFFLHGKVQAYMRLRYDLGESGVTSVHNQVFIRLSIMIKKTSLSLDN